MNKKKNDVVKIEDLNNEQQDILSNNVVKIYHFIPVTDRYINNLGEIVVLCIQRTTSPNGDFVKIEETTNPLKYQWVDEFTYFLRSDDIKNTFSEAFSKKESISSKEISSLDALKKLSVTTEKPKIKTEKKDYSPVFRKLDYKGPERRATIRRWVTDTPETYMGTQLL